MGRLNRQLDPTLCGVETERLESDLRKRIVGQDEAIEQIARIYQTYLAGMCSPGRPVGNLLFLGPTGSGKTRMVEAAAESLLGDARAAVQIDCAEFQHSHEISKLIGSPPGYLGHRETHPLLSQQALNKYHTERIKLSFVLFDEIEKASDSLWNLLLGILDKATLTLGDNSRVDFSRTMIFMTGNVGAAEMSSMLCPSLGFAAFDAETRQAAGVVDEKLSAKIARAGVEAARRKFTPEFMNRLDRIVVFRSLTEAELRKILVLELNIVQQRIFRSPSGAPFVFLLTHGAQDLLLREGTDLKYGARHLKRAIERRLVHPLSNLIATGQVRGGDVLRVDYERALDRLTFFKESEGVPTYVMAQMVDGSAAEHHRPIPAGAVATMPRAGRARSSRR
jgi:ATP-dependent Clp protease ATP-binding subunit ClpB